MDTTNALAQIADQPALDVIAEPLSRAVRGAYDLAGPAGERAKNTLHGVWLRHPLHPVFTDLPLGAWTTGLVLDAVAASNGDESMSRAADVALAVGLAGAAGAAVTGLTDWSETDGHARRTGLLHGLLNIAATTLVATAFVLRKRGARGAGESCAIAGYGLAVGAAWFGGDLVYDQRVGVTHAVTGEPESFTAVASSADLADDSMTRARCDDLDLVVARQHGRVCALAHSCAHLGGPLSEGTLKEGSVVCPWHGSEFALEDGRVINGPATQDQPSFDVRERAGRIEVKARG
jgi:nitrite reductase/ring-hydroxylating ferredoxin subunit/uncharacterized membrane protein